MNKQEKHRLHWHKSLRLVLILLIVWFSVSFGAGIFLKDWLDQFTIGTAPLGFWMAQQGAIICFVILLIVYAVAMNRLDKSLGFDEDNEA